MSIKTLKTGLKFAHNWPRPFYFTVQNWFFILWNLGTRHLFSYLWPQPVPFCIKCNQCILLHCTLGSNTSRSCIRIFVPFNYSYRNALVKCNISYLFILVKHRKYFVLLLLFYKTSNIRLQRTFGPIVHCVRLML